MSIVYSISGWAWRCRRWWFAFFRQVFIVIEKARGRLFVPIFPKHMEIVFMAYPPLLTTTRLSQEYIIGQNREKVLDNISLSIGSGEFVVISGSSGSGKTTLLSLLSGLDRPTAGTVTLDGHEITAMSEDQLGDVRNRLTGFVFQAFHLVPSLTSLENIMFPAELSGDPRSREKGSALLRRVGLWQRRDSFPDQLSGGEKQRVAICRALINNPKILFADEPTGNLDSENSQNIISLMTELHREQGTTLVMATHSNDIADIADRVIRLRDGRLLTGITGE